MSKAGLVVAAAAGLTMLSATPAMAVGLPFDNCTQAANVGVFNIPVNTPGYQPKLDRDKDGFGCDAAGTAPYDGSIVAKIVADNTPVVPPVPPTVPAVEAPQIEQMPVGGVDAGVAQPSSNGTGGGIALGGGLVLAVAGGAYLVRRRHAGQA